MNHHFVQQQTNEQIGSMMREAAEHRLAKENEQPRQSRVLPLFMNAGITARRLIHFLSPTRSPRLPVEDPRQAR